MSKPEETQERKEKVDAYRTAIKDARHVFNTYKAAHPDEAWETIRKIIFDKKLK